ncbi:1,2-dihydroxy-3-keto-5-methylthiopentene dioxygenase [Pseudoalteromonas luteoviolacea]|uniref:1,2-dihydroxy-3-keto-5-methylthiopentene dioxygenase n=1 Tax=Pseudoalteromonas luteoviolacea TaxID=43657 RepID=UPI001B36F316|nr:acireductone dioxygenase [Pseudoalteromonas luteoviolacea]MBQ4839670.1 acireductone dioxygenase [Pseudoalteromonas luteoviolacea]
MSYLHIYQEHQPNTATFQSDDVKQITQQLAEVGVRFEQWQATQILALDALEADIIEAYQHDITRLKAQGGYQTVDVIALQKGNPNAAQLREKFLFEHTHSEDEVRFFVAGQGLFCLHIQDKVYQVLCQQGDLISVPQNTPHWFDMGSDPEFTAIRLFNNTEGWVAKETGSNIAKQFPMLD